MLKLLGKLLGGSNDKKIKQVLPIIDHINALEPEFEKYSDEELRAKTDEFKKMLNIDPLNITYSIFRTYYGFILEEYFPNHWIIRDSNSGWDIFHKAAHRDSVR